MHTDHQQLLLVLQINGAENWTVDEEEDEEESEIIILDQKMQENINWIWNLHFLHKRFQFC